ncbi:LAETG motif-containing sortase-dependent surface protein [Streptomyces hainanensis]|nr:LAETG motif-containing sortase-dependent surface protein [Streptomyces hainanensis]
MADTGAGSRLPLVAGLAAATVAAGAGALVLARRRNR